MKEDNFFDNLMGDKYYKEKQPMKFNKPSDDYCDSDVNSKKKKSKKFKKKIKKLELKLKKSKKQGKKKFKKERKNILKKYNIVSALSYPDKYSSSRDNFNGKDNLKKYIKECVKESIKDYNIPKSLIDKSKNQYDFEDEAIKYLVNRVFSMPYNNQQYLRPLLSQPQYRQDIIDTKFKED